jgi:hypothetical protein
VTPVPFVPDPKQLGRYMALAQVGFEMAAPIFLGWWLDATFDWAPWGVITGAVVGLLGGIAHLVALSSRWNNEKPPDNSPT